MSEYGKTLQLYMAENRQKIKEAVQAATHAWVKKNAVALSTTKHVEIKSGVFSQDITPRLMAAELARDPNFVVSQNNEIWYATFKGAEKASLTIQVGPTYDELDTLLTEIESECRSAIALDFPRQGIKSIFEAICKFNKWDFQEQWDRAVDGKDAYDEFDE
jgi:hypothetical protein